MNAPQCPDCRKAMEEGFIPDNTYGELLQSHWSPGLPEKASFFGLPLGIKVTRAGLHPIQAYRCPDCGLLRSYALPKTTRK